MPAPYNAMAGLAREQLRSTYTRWVPAPPGVKVEGAAARRIEDDPFGFPVETALPEDIAIVDFEHAPGDPNSVYHREAGHARAAALMHQFEAALAHAEIGLNAYEKLTKESPDIGNEEDDYAGLSRNACSWITRAGATDEQCARFSGLLASDSARALLRVIDKRGIWDPGAYGLERVRQLYDNLIANDARRSQVPFLMAGKLGVLGDKSGFLAWEAKQPDDIMQRRSHYRWAAGWATASGEDIAASEFAKLVNAQHPADRELAFAILRGRLESAQRIRDYDTAATIYPEMLKLKPKHGPTLQAAGDAERRRGHYKTAIELYEELLKLPLYERVFRLEGPIDEEDFAHRTAAWGIVEAYEALGEAKKAYQAAMNADGYPHPYPYSCALAYFGMRAETDLRLAELALSAGEEDVAVARLEVLLDGDSRTDMRASQLLIDLHRRRGTLADLPDQIAKRADAEYEAAVLACTEAGLPIPARPEELRSDLLRARRLAKMSLLADRGDAEALWSDFKQLLRETEADTVTNLANAVSNDDNRRLVELAADLVVAMKREVEPILLREVQLGGAAENWAIVLLARSESQHVSYSASRWLRDFCERHAQDLEHPQPSARHSAHLMQDPFADRPAAGWDGEYVAWRHEYEREQVARHRRVALAEHYCYALALMKSPRAKRVWNDFASRKGEAIEAAVNQAKWLVLESESEPEENDWDFEE